MRKIGLDLGNITGYAYTDGPTVEPVLSGVWDFGKGKPKFQDHAYRYLRFKAELEHLIRTGITVSLVTDPVAVVFYEAAAFQQGASAEQWQSYRTMLETVAARFTEQGDIVSWKGIAASTLKLRATGRGGASKNAVIAAAGAKWAINPEDDNHADALWVLQCGLEELGMGTA